MREKKGTPSAAASDRPRPGDKRSPNASAFFGPSAAFQADQTPKADKLVTAALQARLRAAEGPWQARLGAIRPQGKQESRCRRPTSSSRPPQTGRQTITKRKRLFRALCRVLSRPNAEGRKIGHGCPSGASEGR